MTKSIQNLIFLDRLFAPVYAACSWILPYFFSKKDNDKVLVIKLFGMGSIVRIANVMKHSDFSKTKLELVTFSNNREASELLGIKTHCIRNGNVFLILLDSIRLLFKIWGMKRTNIVDLERTSNLSGIFRLLCAIGKNCSSFTFEDQNKVKNNQTYVTLKDKPAIQAIAEILHVKWESNPEEVKRECENKIIVNVNAGEYLAQRRYPIKHFVKIVEQLNRQDGSLEFVLTGSKKEKKHTQQLADQLDLLGIPYKNTAGKLSLADLVELLKSSRLLITNDSGPLHLAYHYEVPVVALWGPTSHRLVGYPDSYRMKNVSIEKDCSPCFIHPKSKVAKTCANRIDCLQELTPEKVLMAVSEMSSSLDKFALDVR